MIWRKMLVIIALPLVMIVSWADYSGPQFRIPGVRPEDYGMVADGVCTPVGNPTGCTGTDNAPAYNAMMIALCALSEVQTSDLMVGRATINFQSSNYYFHTQPNPITCNGIVLKGAQWGGTVFTSDPGINLIQFGTFSTTPAKYAAGIGAWGGVYDISFDQPGNTVAGSRTGSFITDNGAGFLTIEDVHCRQTKYCFNAPYGGQLDTLRRPVFEYADIGLYCGPLCNQTHVEDAHIQFTKTCVELEGGSQISFDGITDLNSCGTSTDNTGNGFYVVANQSVTAQGVWICPGTPGSATGCGGYVIDQAIDVDNLWAETNNGALGYSPNCFVQFDGNYGDAIRGFRVHNMTGRFGGTLLAGSAVICSTASFGSQSGRIENFTYTNTFYAAIFKGISRWSCKNIRAASGTSTMTFGSSATQTGCEPTPGLPYVAEAISGGAITPDSSASNANSFTVAVTVNFTMNNPINLAVGNTYTWVMTQDSTGGHLVTFSSVWSFPGDPTAGRLAPGANAVTVYVCPYDGASLRCDVQRGQVSPANNGAADGTTFAPASYVYGGASHVSDFRAQTTLSITGATPQKIATCPSECVFWVDGCTGTVTNYVCTSGNGFFDEVRVSQTAVAKQGTTFSTIGSPGTTTYSSDSAGGLQIVVSTGTQTVTVFGASIGSR